MTRDFISTQVDGDISNAVALAGCVAVTPGPDERLPLGLCLAGALKHMLVSG